ncbi:MAG: stage II sporulation protein M [Wenzhouxiangella sp.]
MNQRDFIQQRQARWDHFDRLLRRLGGQRDQTVSLADFPAEYRRLCSDLALARSRGYSLGLVDALQRRVIDGHRYLYRPRNALSRELIQFIARDFPAQVRQEWRLTLWCTLLLFGPMIWLFAQIGSSPEFVYRVLSPETVDQVDAMYGGEEGLSRGAGGDVMMFAFYIMNNIGVALRTFAGGLVFGLGSFFILLFNGVHIGAVAAHLSFAGYNENFWTFVIGHGALELPAIVLAGVAGSRLGLALMFPGPYSRLASLRLASRGAVRLLYGVILMLFLAAGLEAFWSASPVPALGKYLIGGLLWLLVGLYFLLSGRRQAT